MVTVDDVLQHCVAQTCVPSSFGAQLEKISTTPGGGKAQVPDPHHAAEQEERRIFEQGPIIRCLDEFCRLKDAKAFDDKPALAKLHKEAGGGRSMGELAVRVLRCYKEWSTTSDSRALVAVYDWATSVAPRAYPPVVHDEVNLTQAFGQDKGTAHQARIKAADLYADALLALSAWVPVFNRKSMRMSPNGIRNFE